MRSTRAVPASLVVASLAAGGAAHWVGVVGVYALLAAFAGLNGLQAGLALVAALSGLAAGLVGRAAAPDAPAVAALGGWAVWALAAVLAWPTFPRGTGWLALPTGLLLALAAGRFGAPRPARPSAPGDLGPSLIGALAGVAVLVFGVALLGWAAGVGLRSDGGTPGYFENVYLRWMGAALWVAMAVGAVLSVAVPLTGRRPNGGRPAAAILGLVAFLALGASAAPLLNFHVACLVGAPLPPLRWVAGGASC